MSARLDYLFNPRSIAVIGASTNKAKLGRIIYDNIKNNGFKGRLWGVNKKGGRIGSTRLYTGLDQIKSVIDLAVVVIPAPFVLSVVKQAVQLKVKHLVVITAGFKESGPAGAKLEAQLVKALKGSSTRLLGVNCLGLTSQPASLNATFVKSMSANDSGIAFMSQSGAFGAAVLDRFQTSPLGLHYFVSLGNKTDINELDLIDYWTKDKQVKVIAAYLESITDGVKFIKLAARAGRQKPIIMMIPGRSTQAQQAISSHTGSLVKDSQIISLALAKAGVVEVNNLDQLFTYLKVFTYLLDRPVSQHNIIITNAGGPAILTTDLVIKHGLKLTYLKPTETSKLRGFLPASAALGNPIDVLGDADASRYQQTFKVITQAKYHSNYLIILTPQLTTQPVKTAQAIIDQLKPTKRAVMAFFIGGQQVAKGLSLLDKQAIPAFGSINTPLKALTALRYYQQQNIKLHRWGSLSLPSKITRQLAGQSGHLDPIITARLIHHLGLKVPTSLYHPLDQIPWDKNLKQVALVIASRWPTSNYPVVAKLVAKSLSHSSDIKAVHLNLTTKSQLTQAIYQILKLAARHRLTTSTAYLCLQQQVHPGPEMIAGLKKTDNFGFVLVTGSGGVLTELYQDVTTIILPTSQAEIKSHLKDTKIYQLISGYRGGAVYDINMIVKSLYQLANLPKAIPNLKAADFNPLIITQQGVYIVDAEIYLV